MVPWTVVSKETDCLPRKVPRNGMVIGNASSVTVISMSFPVHASEVTLAVEHDFPFIRIVMVIAYGSFIELRMRSTIWAQWLGSMDP